MCPFATDPSSTLHRDKIWQIEKLWVQLQAALLQSCYRLCSGAKLIAPLWPLFFFVFDKCSAFILSSGNGSREAGGRCWWGMPLYSLILIWMPPVPCNSSLVLESEGECSDWCDSLATSVLHQSTMEQLVYFPTVGYLYLISSMWRVWRHTSSSRSAPSCS